MANTAYDLNARSKTVTKRRMSPRVDPNDDTKMRMQRTLMADSKHTAPSTHLSGKRYSTRNSSKAQFKTLELPVHKQRKDQSTGRINCMFTSKTPKLNDPDIKKLLT